MKAPSVLARSSRWFLSGALIAGVMLGVAAAPSQAASPAAGPPIKIGFSVSLSGDFSSDGQAILQGYRLWAADVNSHGGLLGRKVRLIYYDDASSTTQVQTDYTKLITSDKVDLTFGPFSTLLTIPATAVARRYGYAFLAPAGGGPLVFQQNFHNFFFVQPSPVARNLVSFTHWLLTLPKSRRPTTAAYVTIDDPFAKPEVDTARGILSRHGVRSVYYTVVPSEVTDFQPMALSAAHTHAQLVVIGSPGPDLSIALINGFKQQHYNPKAIIATSGPDQGKTFSKAVGLRNTEGIMVPEGWWYGAKTYQNTRFISEYLRTYHGTVADISQDTPEAYSVGQVAQQAVTKIGSLDNGKLIAELHRGTFQSVQGPMRFDSAGRPQGESFIVQWRNGNTVPVYPAQYAVKSVEYPKPHWH
ncbi:MAG TPA: amino acid ABC transporter substrate-binding protein [Chloroflexota bacterium]|nr:amino acid ABC transporter substrate-binding protein [Chloroflexota bacterium]